MLQLALTRFGSPLGEILLVTDQKGVLRALDFHDHEGRMNRLLRLHCGQIKMRDGKPSPSITRALSAYFAGDHAALAGISVLTGGTTFQRTVWAALRDIPIGATKSYGAIAAVVGNPGASRAVGLANGSNPVAIVVPCHRVVGANAALTGFGGGLHRKRWLLEHEGVAVASDKVVATNAMTPEPPAPTQTSFFDGTHSGFERQVAGPSNGN